LCNQKFNTSDIDECSNITVPCDTHADCTNTQGSYICTCKKGWDAILFDRPPTGAPQTCQNVNECLSPYLNLCNRKTSRCFDTPGDYECQCLTGYKRPNEADKRTCIGGLYVFDHDFLRSLTSHYVTQYLKTRNIG
uniref:EGF-like domain-containing protein n=1 Tax=Romanomermis culicivorax TaxID=13658 RepID=A0A915J8U5_ROMCU